MGLLIRRSPYLLPGSGRLIPLGGGKYAIVDRANYWWLAKFRWFAKKSSSCTYAVRRVRLAGREHLIRMHREITGCPPEFDVHHHNHHSLDNREANLFPMLPGAHARLPKSE